MPWSEVEVEATVASYLRMLREELRGGRLNKAEQRRALGQLLSGRTDGAMERKHQNISAVLLSVGYPYINGYKPLGHYQRSLVESVLRAVGHDLALRETLSAQVAAPARRPTTGDILGAMVAGPAGGAAVAKAEPAGGIRELAVPTPRDYLAEEAANRSLGAEGERFVMEYEVARLISLREERLAAKVEHVSATRGDGAGFDILSFDIDGRERLIEVKTTNYGQYTPFYVSRNELEVSRRERRSYHLYRAFDFQRGARIFSRQGALDGAFALEPEQWIARV